MDVHFVSLTSSLARAVYSRARHLILDDVFAAVDVHVAKRLVEKCLKGPLLQGRTVVSEGV